MTTTFTSRIVLKNTVWTGIDKISAIFFQFVISFILARYFLKTQVGDFYLVISFVSIFCFLYDLGINDISIREMARDFTSFQNVFENIVPFKLLLSIAALIIIMILSKFYRGTRSLTIYVFLYSFYYVLLYTIIQVQSFFIAKENFKIVAITNVFMKVLLIMILVGYVSAGYREISYLFIFYIASAFITLCIIIWKLKKSFKLKFYYRISDLGLIWKFIKYGFPIMAAGIIGLMIHNIDILVIKFYWNSEIVALYSIAYLIGMAIKVLPTTYIAAIFPRISRYYKESKDSYRKALTISFKISLVVGIIVPLIGVPFSYKILYWIYGQNYVDAANTLKILFVLGFLIIPTSLSTYFLIASNKQKIFLYLAGATFIINFIADLIFIPYFPISGGAVGSLLATLFYFYASFVIINKKDKLKIKSETVLLPVFVLTTLLFIQFYLASAFTLICYYVICAIIFVLFFYIYPFFDINEKKILAEIISL